MFWGSDVELNSVFYNDVNCIVFYVGIVLNIVVLFSYEVLFGDFDL